MLDDEFPEIFNLFMFDANSRECSHGPGNEKPMTASEEERYKAGTPRPLKTIAEGSVCVIYYHSRINVVQSH